MAEKNSSEEEEPVSWLEESQGAEVFILFNPEDQFLIEKYVLKYLQKKNLKYVTEDQIIHGGLKVEGTVQAVKKCKKTLLIVSKDSKKNIQLSLEIMSALEKSVRDGKMSFMVLMLEGSSMDDIPNIPLMINADRIRHINNISERCLDELINRVRAEVDMSVALPAGNLSAGMVWSHFLGYLQVVLPGLAQAIIDCKWFNPDEPGRGDRSGSHMPVTFFMLLPGSGKAPKNLNDEDENIRQVGKISIESGSRKYTPNVYEVTDPSDGTKYYCCAEYPSAFCAIGQICDLGVCDMTPQQRHLEVERFAYKMEEILNHENNRPCRDIAKLLVFNDEDKQSDTAMPSFHLLKAIKEELHRGPPVVERLLQTQMSRNTKEPPKFKFDACIMYDTDCQEDKNLAEKLRRFLEEHKKKCTQARKNDPPKAIEERIMQSKWVFMFISKSSLQNTQFIQLWMAELLSLSTTAGELRVLPLLIDVDPMKIPDFVRWVTYIDVKKEQQFCERVLQAVNGENITMESQVPVGNVAFGLAWAFEVNYLYHYLPGLNEKFLEKLKNMGVDFDTAECSSDVFEIVPKNCVCAANLQEADRDEKIFKVTPLTVKRNVYGTERTYHSTIYRLIGDNDKDYYFIGEYAAPVRTLGNMHKSMIAGLNNQQLEVQVKEFVKISESIQNHQQMQEISDEPRSPCRFVWFDETKGSLSSLLYEKLQRKVYTKGLDNYFEARKRQKEQSDG